MRRFLPLGALALALSAYACVESSSSWEGLSEDARVDRATVLAELGGQIVATQETFLERARVLEGATSAWAASGAETDRQTAQAAWRDAMAVWQRLELMQVGPAADPMNEIPGAAGLREPIYSWPITNACRVDQELAAQGYGDAAALAEAPPNSRGLDALEYLLFYDGDDNACAPQNVPNVDNSWAPIVAELPARRAAYAARASTVLVRDAEALQQAWAPSGGGFLDELTGAGRSSELFPKENDGINALVAGLFYLEKSTKDMKLAVTLGYSDCTEARCPERAELRYSGASKQAIGDNLAAFRQMFTGGEGRPSFDDLLGELGQETLVARMLEELTAAEEAYAAIDAATLTEAIANEPAAVEALHGALQELMTTLKTEFLSNLDAELPKLVEGDND